MTDPLLPYGRRHRHAPVAPLASALDVIDLRVGHPGSGAPALDGASLRVPAGAKVALVGANGAGKSTLLKAVAGLLPVADGSIKVFGQPVGGCHHRVAYLAQRGEVDWAFPIDVRRLVLGGRFVHLGWLRRPGTRDRAIVDGVLERLGLDGLADRQIGNLSGGQQQRVLLARALAQGADLLLLDEPLAALDVRSRAEVEWTLDDLHRTGKSLLVATHDPPERRGAYDAVVSLRGGKARTHWGNAGEAFGPVPETSIHVLAG